MTLGETLRSAREAKAITLEQATEDTRIRVKFLRALEASDYASLPGAVYTKGFLRTYGAYLDLDPDELVALYTSERGGRPEPRQRLDPIRPVTRRSFVFTPSVFIPIIVVAGVGLFLGYLYQQITTFAVPPRLEITDPRADALVHEAEFTLRGRTAADARVSVTVLPGPDRYADVRPASDGTFEVTVKLRPGANHIEIGVLDTTGKANAVTRVIRYEQVASAPQGPQLIVEQPANGATYTDGAVTVSGRVDSSVAALLVNGTPVRPGSDGRFALTMTFTQGAHTVRVVARTAAGAEVQEQRTVSVQFTRAVVFVEVRGGPAWILAFVDGVQDGRTNRVYPEGSTLSFAGREVVVRTGNAGATHLTVNGESLGIMGRTGEVAERRFALP